MSVTAFNRKRRTEAEVKAKAEKTVKKVVVAESKGEK